VKLSSLGPLMLAGQVGTAVMLLLVWAIGMALRWPWWAVMVLFCAAVTGIASGAWAFGTTLSSAEDGS
jgi:hypothetical protein